MPPSVSYCLFQSAFFLAQGVINTHVSSLWNFFRLSFRKFEASSKEKFDPLKYFSSHRILKSSSPKFTDRLNVIWYRVQVTEATNGFTFKLIINSWMDSWPGLTVIPPSETCELFWAILTFTTLFSPWNQRNFFFQCFWYMTKSTNFYQ